MGQNSTIEWTDHTFNPWWGCQRVSPGCQHCYAETLAQRWGHKVWGPAKTTPRRMMSENYWKQPHKWNKAAEAAGERKRVFCASMADVFEDHPDVEEARTRLFDLISDTPGLDWLLLTKRPENIKPMLIAAGRGFQSLPPWVWIGTSVENQEQADKRIPELLKVPAHIRFLSCEPLLGPVNILPWLQKRFLRDAPFHGDWYHTIHWVIAGGESGHSARPMHPQWARSLRDQCQAAGVSYFFKQWGEWVGHGATPIAVPEQSVGPERCRWLGMDGSTRPLGLLEMQPGDEFVYHVGKSRAGRMLDGRTWDELPTTT